MSKHSEKKKQVLIEQNVDQTKSYFQTYVPTPYVASTYETPLVMQSITQPTQIIQQEPTIIREKRVIQGNTQYLTNDIIKNEQCCINNPCQINTCIPCCNDQKVITRQVYLKEKQQPTIDYQQKLDEIEKLHNQEIKEMELRMLQQIEQLQNEKQYEQQQRQMNDLKQSIIDIKGQLIQNKQSNNNSQIQFIPQQDKQYEKLEKVIKKKKEKIKLLKSTINNLQQELQFRTTNNTQIRQPQIIEVPIIKDNPELLNQIHYLEQERGMLLTQLDQFRISRSDINQLSFQQDPERIRLQQDYSRMLNDFKFLENENIKLTTIVAQKDELIRSLEQRISVELSRQSILLQQNSPHRVIVEQTTRPLQYVGELQQKQFIIQDSVVQPTLYQGQQVIQVPQSQTLPNVKIVQ